MRKLSDLIQQLKCSVPVLTRWKARGFPSPECDSDNSNPLFVVGGRAERQLSFEGDGVRGVCFVVRFPMVRWVSG